MTKITCTDYSPEQSQVQEVTDVADFLSHHRPSWSRVLSAVFSLFSWRLSVRVAFSDELRFAAVSRSNPHGFDAALGANSRSGTKWRKSRMRCSVIRLVS